jgi:hypothetical protein
MMRRLGDAVTSGTGTRRLGEVRRRCIQGFGYTLTCSLAPLLLCSGAIKSGT